jgi:hypothetical protein
MTKGRAGSMKKTTLSININQSDFSKLNKYGFDFEKNIADYLHGIAEAIKQEEKAKRIAKKDPFEKVTAVYTGGGIWLFYGKLKTGEYFLTDDYGYTMILDTSPENLDESLYNEWQEQHFVRVVGTHAEERAFLHSLIDRLGRKNPADDDGGITDDELDRYREDWDTTFKTNWGVEA